MGKKEILRKCVASNEVKNRNDLFRVVKNKEGEVSVDFTFKAHGRGAWISKDKDLILLAKKKKVLNRVFECEVSDEIYDFLISRL